jgi:hypothetical protein
MESVSATRLSRCSQVSGNADGNCWLSLLSLRFVQRVVILGSRPGLELGLASRPAFVLLLAQPAVAALRSARCDSWIMTGTCAGSRVETSSCLLASSACCRCASVSVLCFFDDDRGLSWVSRRDQLLSCRWIRLLSLRLGQRVVILGSRPGLALGLASSPALVLLLAQPAVAVLRSACCDSSIMTGT